MISDEMNRNHTQPFIAGEIVSIVQSITPLKASVLNGLNAVFIKRYWTKLGANTVDLCLNILSGNGRIEDIDSTSIVMILKNFKLMSMVDFQSIRLCNVIYKIVTKTLEID